MYDNMLGMKPSGLPLLTLVVVTYVPVLFADSIDGWTKMKTIHPSHTQVSTPNILRCGKLCERQGNCIAATFAPQEGMCYMHDTDAGGNAAGTGGRYLHKKFRNATRNVCDKQKQIVLPSAQTEEGNCYTVKEPPPTTKPSTHSTTTEPSTHSTTTEPSTHSTTTEPSTPTTNEPSTPSTTEPSTSTTTEPSTPSTTTEPSTHSTTTEPSTPSTTTEPSTNSTTTETSTSTTTTEPSYTSTTASLAAECMLIPDYQLNMNLSICYKIVAEATSKADAIADCQDDHTRAHLITVVNLKMLNFLATADSKLTDFWIDGDYLFQTWDGQPLPWERWCAGTRPTLDSNRAIRVDHNNVCMKDDSFGASKHYICQIE